MLHHLKPIVWVYRPRIILNICFFDYSSNRLCNPKVQVFLLIFFPALSTQDLCFEVPSNQPVFEEVNNIPDRMFHSLTITQFTVHFLHFLNVIVSFHISQSDGRVETISSIEITINDLFLYLFIHNVSHSMCSHNHNIANTACLGKNHDISHLVKVWTRVC